MISHLPSIFIPYQPLMDFLLYHLHLKLCSAVVNHPIGYVSILLPYSISLTVKASYFEGHFK